MDSPALGPRPFLTWYGADGERIELSATVTANWVAKTTNLLVEEFDAGPGTLVRVDLPVHWRTAVWALAAWRTGAGVVLGEGSAPSAASSVSDGGPRADVIVTDRPATLDATELARAEIVAQVLPSLARAFDGELPPGAMDAARAVGSYSDVIGYVPPTDPAATAVVAASHATAHSDLGSWATELPASARLAVPVDGTSRDVEDLLQLVLGALRASSSLVLYPETHPDPSRILTPEHATPLPR
ncbi:MAG: TIGR03089 family protein [Actinomycetales bacterium]|nr:TIGR03089 family protein [Actinomycetales bacterium]